MILETCRRGKHVNRIVMRQSYDKFGQRHLEEWHVCRFCPHERKHGTRNINPQQDSRWRARR